MTAPGQDGFVRGIIKGIVNVLGGGAPVLDEQLQRAAGSDRSRGSDSAEGSGTVELDPAGVPELRISYAPDPDGEPDAGEVVWTWVPYAENDGRGKDRPVLVIGRRDPLRVYAVRLTSRSHEGERDFLEIGPGEWDPAGRPSWVDVDRLYSVPHAAMRREGAELDQDRFALVARALQQRHGWRFEG